MTRHQIIAIVLTGIAMILAGLYLCCVPDTIAPSLDNKINPPVEILSTTTPTTSQQNPDNQTIIQPKPLPVEQATASSTITVSLTIANKYNNTAYPITNNETVLSVLEDLNKTEPELKLETKSYAGLGTLITSLYSYTNGVSDKYWQYEINGIMPQVGAGVYKLSGGEHINWKYTESTY